VNASWSRSFRESLASKILGGAGSSSSPSGSYRRSHGIQLNDSHFSHSLVWRSIPHLESDPDQPWNPRLKVLASVGLGLAAAVPFNLHGDQGIVIYMARDNVDRSKLQSETNEAYLVSATDLIAAAYALRGPRQQAVRERRAELAEGLRRARDKILSLHRQGVSLKDHVDMMAGEADQTPALASPPLAKTSSGASRLGRMTTWVGRTAASAAKKSAGAGAPIPPSYSWRQTSLTFMGSLTTLLAVTSLSDALVRNWGEQYEIVLGYVQCYGLCFVRLQAVRRSCRLPHPACAVF
jgi:hypothetical protein